MNVEFAALQYELHKLHKQRDTSMQSVGVYTVNVASAASNIRIFETSASISLQQDGVVSIFSPTFFDVLSQMCLLESLCRYIYSEKQVTNEGSTYLAISYTNICLWKVKSKRSNIRIIYTECFLSYFPV